MLKKNYVANTLWLMLEKAIRLFSALFVGILVARYLGPAQYGTYNFAIGFVSLFGAIATLGLDTVIVRDIVNKAFPKHKLLGTCFLLKVIATVTTWLLILLLSWWLNYSSDEILLILLIAFASILQTVNVIDFDFQASVKSKYVAKLLMLQLVLSAFLKIYLVYSAAALQTFALVFTFESLIYLIGLIWLYKHVNKENILLWRWDTDIAIAMLKESFPYIIAGLAISAYLKIDIIMIKSMLSDYDAGIYSAATRLSEAWYFVPMVLVSSFFPAILAAKTISSRLYYDRISALSGALIILAVSLSAFCSLFAVEIITLLYGVEFTGAGSVLIVHIWCAIFVFLGVISHRWYVAEHKKYFALWRSIVGLAINVWLNYLLLPIYGVLGAAYATLVSQFLVGYFFDLLHRETRPLFIAKTIGILSLFTFGQAYFRKRKWHA